MVTLRHWSGICLYGPKSLNDNMRDTFFVKVYIAFFCHSSRVLQPVSLESWLHLLLPSLFGEHQMSRSVPCQSRGCDFCRNFETESLAGRRLILRTATSYLFAF